MTSVTPTRTPSATDVRCTIKPESGRPTGYVDGAWWPRSRDLAAELPALVAALEPRLGPVERVSYHLDEWEPAPRRIVAGSAVVRLGGHHQQGVGTLDLDGAARRLTLLVVPPEADTAVADRALAAAGSADNADRVATLLARP